MKKKVNNLFILKIIFMFVILYYIITYYYYLYPLYNLEDYQSKEWIEELTNSLILGATDNNQLKNLTKYEINDISFLYYFFLFNTKKYTIWIIFNLNNKFSSKGNLVFYYYNFEKKTHHKNILPVDFNNLKTTKVNRTLLIQYLSNYSQMIDFENNIIYLNIDFENIHLNVTLNIEDYTTTVASFLPRYKLINPIINTSVTSTNSKDEWASDNPIIGKIINIEFNWEQLESGGSFWFDNFIGCNNYYITEYYWFVILIEDWLIYLLWYNDYEKMNDPDTTIPIYIKDIKNNKILHCSPGSKMSYLYDKMNDLINPVDIKITKNPNIKYGDEKYDDFVIYFKSSKINFKISSIKNECQKVIEYDYYNNGFEPKTNSEWDKKYYSSITNLRYYEYIMFVDLELDYNNEKTKYKTKLISDGLAPIDHSRPSIIKAFE